ncbi:d-xylulose reductase [Trypanosoma conorhini]|uniref:D-xylulose reductase n=1 Tax=Trypanosoma conorhini TaxID=83891 RepID=A0A3R7KU49_9TRYP|nr:d-xylulose reductase [Trypanosoma conorhini]RNF09756.1 d-xylulose reductase [Trypanosoma conorhini]
MTLMKSLVLEKPGEIRLREIEVNDVLGENDVRVKVHTVGICGSDVHYYEYGHIGPFVVKQPMILGHEAAGTVVAVGSKVRHLSVGDRVAMEPGIPNMTSPQTLAGLYNLDPDIAFFATPPVHGCLSTTVIHPAILCFKLPENVSYEEGALCEPIAVGMHSATKAGVKPGDVALVIGSGTIGIVTALAALAAGCSDVIICDVVEGRLKAAAQYEHVHPVLSKGNAVKEKVQQLTDGQGVDCVFECSGAAAAYPLIYEHAAPGATAVLTGMPVDPVTFDVVAAQAKEITFQTIFRYRNMYPRVIRLLRSGRMNVKPLVTGRFKLRDGVKAYERAALRNPTDVKIIIEME